MNPGRYNESMASYGQYCALAKALEVLGDRWTLLIVRELMARGPLRYSELQAGLPGIASNLLATRLANLEAAGVISRGSAKAKSSNRFSLTDRGRELRNAMLELGRWGEPLLERASKTDTFRTCWMSLGLDLLRDGEPKRPRASIQLQIRDESAVVDVSRGIVSLRDGTDPAPDATLEGEPMLVCSVLFRRMTLNAARKRGLRFEGDPSVLDRLQPA